MEGRRAREGEAEERDTDRWRCGGGGGGREEEGRAENTTRTDGEAEVGEENGPGGRRREGEVGKTGGPSVCVSAQGNKGAERRRAELKNTFTGEESRGKKNKSNIQVRHQEMRETLVCGRVGKRDKRQEISLNGTKKTQGRRYIKKKRATYRVTHQGEVGQGEGCWVGKKPKESKRT